MDRQEHLEAFQLLSKRIKLNSDKLTHVIDLQRDTLKALHDGRVFDREYLDGRLDLIEELIRTNLGSASDDDGEIPVEAAHPDVKASIEGCFGGEDF